MNHLGNELMNHLFQFLRKVFIVSLTGIFISVSTFTGEAFAAKTLIDACSIYTGEVAEQPNFENPPFAYTNDVDVDEGRQGVTLDAVQDKLYLDVDRSQLDSYEYDGYLYKTIFYDQGGTQKTIVRATGEPAQITREDYDPETSPDKMVGTYTPPTIVTSPGEFEGNLTRATLNSFDLTLTNNLPIKVQLPGSLPKTKENLENQSQYTNLHYHGFNISPLLGSDDVLVDVPSNKTSPSLDEGGYYPDDNPDNPKFGGPISEYNMTLKIPSVHQSGLFWYHSHAHSLSQQQVRGGLSGGIIIKGMDDYYKLLNTNGGLEVRDGEITEEDRMEPEKFSVVQQVMMFKDFNDVLGTSGKNCLTLNGQVNPKITIKPGEVQLWRIANSGSDQYMNIALVQSKNSGITDPHKIENPGFVEPNDQPNFIILARDGDVVETPIPTNSVLLPPAARVELLVVGGVNQTNPQDEYYLVSDLSTGLSDDQDWANGSSSYLLATVEVEDNANKVCYSQEGDNLSVTLSTYIECSGDKSLYDYLSEAPTYQDKILPPSEAIMSGDLEPCQNKYYHYAYRIEENGKKIVYDENVPYDGTASGEDQRCITQPTGSGSGIPMYRDPLTKKRYFYFSTETETFSKFFLKGFEEEQEGVQSGDDQIKELFDGNRIDKISRTGDLEEWHLVNVDGFSHVFHIHQLDFVVTKVLLPKNNISNNETYNNYTLGNCESDQPLPGTSDLGTECELEPQGYRDVINLPKHSITTVRIPFVNPFITGIFVHHCHILGHEDRGMMNNIKVVNPDGYEIAGVTPTFTSIDGGSK
ncbi:MAG: multicopper oxidase domain-containing protein [Symploca sp. SIO2G7]|nr:multicopper oxidase domain-containing protein [Symploca sp. SIO2G7]